MEEYQKSEKEYHNKFYPKIEKIPSSIFRNNKTTNFHENKEIFNEKKKKNISLTKNEKLNFNFNINNNYHINNFNEKKEKAYFFEESKVKEKKNIQRSSLSNQKINFNEKKYFNENFRNKNRMTPENGNSKKSNFFEEKHNYSSKNIFKNANFSEKNIFYNENNYLKKNPNQIFSKQTSFIKNKKLKKSVKELSNKKKKNFTNKKKKNENNRTLSNNKIKTKFYQKNKKSIKMTSISNLEENIQNRNKKIFSCTKIITQNSFLNISLINNFGDFCDDLKEVNKMLYNFLKISEKKKNPEKILVKYIRYFKKWKTVNFSKIIKNHKFCSLFREIFLLEKWVIFFSYNLFFLNIRNEKKNFMRISLILYQSFIFFLKFLHKVIFYENEKNVDIFNNFIEKSILEKNNDFFVFEIRNEKIYQFLERSKQEIFKYLRNSSNLLNFNILIQIEKLEKNSLFISPTKNFQNLLNLFPFIKKNEKIEKIQQNEEKQNKFYLTNNNFYEKKKADYIEKQKNRFSFNSQITSNRLSNHCRMKKKLIKSDTKKNSFLNNDFIEKKQSLNFQKEFEEKKKLDRTKSFRKNSKNSYYFNEKDKYERNPKINEEKKSLSSKKKQMKSSLSKRKLEFKNSKTYKYSQNHNYPKTCKNSKKRSQKNSIKTSKNSKKTSPNPKKTSQNRKIKSPQNPKKKTPQNPKIKSPQNPKKKSLQKKNLILDLDETLIHFHKQSSQILLRPFVHYFLSSLSPYYNLTIFTAAQKDYADFIINRLDEGCLISRRFYRKDALLQNNVFFKDISKVDRNLGNCIFIDNLEENFGRYEDNGICVSSWVGDQGDTVLLDLIPFLKRIVIKGYEDLREPLKVFKETFL